MTELLEERGEVRPNREGRTRRSKTRRCRSALTVSLRNSLQGRKRQRHCVEECRANWLSGSNSQIRSVWTCSEWEHHRREFLDSAARSFLRRPQPGRNAFAHQCGHRIKAPPDPVRVFQEFATLDLLSQGRAEMIVGRGSFIEAFPLFGLGSRITIRCLLRSWICF